MGSWNITHFLDINVLILQVQLHNNIYSLTRNLPNTFATKIKQRVSTMNSLYPLPYE